MEAHLISHSVTNSNATAVLTATPSSTAAAPIERTSRIDQRVRTSTNTASIAQRTARSATNTIEPAPGRSQFFFRRGPAGHTFVEYGPVGVIGQKRAQRGVSLGSQGHDSHLVDSKLLGHDLVLRPLLQFQFAKELTSPVFLAACQCNAHEESSKKRISPRNRLRTIETLDGRTWYPHIAGGGRHLIARW